MTEVSEHTNSTSSMGTVENAFEEAGSARKEEKLLFCSFFARAGPQPSGVLGAGSPVSVGVHLVRQSSQYILVRGFENSLVPRIPAFRAYAKRPPISVLIAAILHHVFLSTH